MQNVFVLTKFIDMACGIIIFIDRIKREGIILDDNEQEISFSIEGLLHNTSLFETVEFQITLGDNGLMAVDVKTTTDIIK